MKMMQINSQHLSHAADRASALIAQHDWLFVDLRIVSWGIEIRMSNVKYPIDVRPHLLQIVMYEKLANAVENPLLPILDSMVKKLNQQTERQDETRTHR